MARVKIKSVREAKSTASGTAGRLSRGPDRLRRSGAGTHGGSVRQKNRRERQGVRRQLRDRDD